MANSLSDNAINLLCELVKIPSHSREENQVSDYFQRHVENMGFEANRVNNNVWIKGSHFSESKPTLLLNAHLDTVKPVSGWTYDPYTPTKVEDKIYGLGTNDDGASLVSLLYAFSELDKKECAYNLVFAASAEEEVSGKNGMEALIPNLPKIDLALVGEPTGMDVAVAEKGLMVLDCYAHGKAGHAARNEGVNAIYKAVKDIEWIRTNILPKQTDMLGPVKMTTTMIEAGTQHNVVPDVCKFVVDVRSNECYTNEEIYEILCQNLESEIKPRSFRLSSSSIPMDNPIVKLALGMGKKAFGSPTLSDQALMHFPSLKMGPGNSSRSHTANEFIMPSEIEDAIETYIKLISEVTL